MLLNHSPGLQQLLLCTASDVHMVRCCSTTEKTSRCTLVNPLRV